MVRTKATWAPPEVRFWSRIAAGPNCCWIWTGVKTEKGYGLLGAGGRNVRAHRFAYELLRGPIPAGMVTDHLCRTRACVNPAHLEIVTNRENLLRGRGFVAENAAKTHCKRGHEFTPENTYMYTGRFGYPRRTCRTCGAQRAASAK